MVTNANYRDILKREYETRARKNPAYSLRAFARHLGISPARLSEIFNGKQGLSARWALRIAERLGFSEQEKQRFSDLAEIAHGKSSLKRRCAETRLSHAKNTGRATLQLDAFQVISDWYHFAITELALTRSFRSDPAWIARRLGLDRKSVELAIERLLRLGLLRKKSDGTLVSDPSFVMTPDGVPSDAIKKFHSQVLEKASKAIYLQSVPERDFSALMLPIDSRHLPEAKKLIREFRRGFSKGLPLTDAKDSVYCLAIQFFKVDEPESTQGESK